MFLGPLQNNLSTAAPKARVFWLEVQAPRARVFWLQVERTGLHPSGDTMRYRRWARDVMASRVTGQGDAVMVAIGRRRVR